MNYNPSEVDQTGNILGRAGEGYSRNTLAGAQALGQGISAGIEGVGKAVQNYGAKTEESKKLDAVAKFYLGGDDPQNKAMLDQFHSADLGTKKGMMAGYLAKKADEEKTFDQNFKLDQAAQQALLQNTRLQQGQAHIDLAREGQTFDQQRAKESQTLRGTLDAVKVPGLPGTVLKNPGTGSMQYIEPDLPAPDPNAPATPIPNPTNPAGPPLGYNYLGKVLPPAAVPSAKMPTESEVSFHTNSFVAKQTLDKLEEIVKRSGTYENGTWLSPWKDAEAAAVLQTAPHTLSYALTKIQDPLGVVTKSDQEAAEKFALSLGAAASKDVALASIAEQRAKIKTYTEGRAKATAAPGVPPDLFNSTGPGGGPKTLDRATAKQFLDAAGGDRAKAEQQARAAGYTF